MRKGISYATLFSLLLHIIEMLIFLEYRIFEATLLLQIIIIIAFQNSSKCHEAGTHARCWKCSPLSQYLSV